MKGPFVMIVHLQVKKGEEKAILESVKPCIAATRKEPGCLTYEFSQDTQDPTKFVFYEKWKSAKALEEHLAAEHTKKFVDGLGKVLEGTPKFTFFTEVN
jgi:quinol monooxygenase YgiN